MVFYSTLRRLYARLEKKKRADYIKGLQKNGLRLGRNVEIIADFFFDPSHCFLISIGDGCTICPNVRLIAHDASTKRFLGYTKIGRIDIKESCFIGDSAIILYNVTVGPNAVIGAGSVVTKDIPANTIAAGNPARVISTLDEYIARIKSVRAVKKIFDEGYLIGNLDEAKRAEMIASIGDSIGFIV